MSNVSASVSGLQGVAGTTSALVWGPVDDSQSPGWVTTNDSQSGAWAPVDESSSVVWVAVAT